MTKATEISGSTNGCELCTDDYDDPLVQSLNTFTLQSLSFQTELLHVPVRRRSGHLSPSESYKIYWFSFIIHHFHFSVIHWNLSDVAQAARAHQNHVQRGQVKVISMATTPLTMTTSHVTMTTTITMTTTSPPSGLQLVAGLGAVGGLPVDAVVVVLPAADEQSLLVAAEVALWYHHTTVLDFAWRGGVTWKINLISCNSG